MNERKSIISAGLLCLLALAVSGCIETSAMYHDNQVQTGQVATLQAGGDQSDTWVTFDLSIDYRYRYDAELLEMSGQVNLSEHYQMNYATLKYLQVYLFFLDKDSRVLETAALNIPQSGSVHDSQSFSQSFRVPPATVAISFGYSGEAGGRKDNKSFYLLPLGERKDRTD